MVSYVIESWDNYVFGETPMNCTFSMKPESCDPEVDFFR